MNICFYLSDHGYGHAAREIALMRFLLEKISDVKIFVKARTSYSFIKNSFSDSRLQTMDLRNDYGVLNKEGSFDTDKEATKKKVIEWVKGWPEYISKEKKFCEENEINLIISDAPPQPFLIAKELNVPSILISNFTWWNIYDKLFDENFPELEAIKKAYMLADRSLHLPFEQEVFGKKIIETGLLGRKVTRTRNQMRSSLKIDEADFLIYLSTSNLELDNTDFPSDKNLTIVSNKDYGFPKQVIIPQEETEIQDYIGMCDLAVIKSGYSTVAEAMHARVPLLITVREGFFDDNVVAGTVEKLGVGKVISNEVFSSGKWLDITKEEVNNLRQKYDDLPERFKSEALDTIFNELMDIRR